MASGGEVAARLMAEQEGRPLPTPPPPDTTVATRVEHWIMHAYADLTTERAIGMSIGPIPWTAVNAYCHEHGIEGDARLVLETCVRALDRADLAQMAERMKGAAHG